MLIRKMFRCTVAFALAATASAQVQMSSNSNRLVVTRQVETDVTDLQIQFERGLADARVEAERAAYNATMSATAEMYNQLQSVQNQQMQAQATVNAQISSLIAGQQSLTASVNAQMSSMAATLSTQLAAADSRAAVAAAQAAEAADAGLSRAQAAAAAGVASNAACNARGQYYNGSECVAFSPVLVRNTATTCNAAGHIKVHPVSGKIEVCDGQKYKASLPSLYHRGYNSNQGCENCYPSHRDVSFRKHYSDTYLRVMYYDNTRMYGWHSREGKWHAYVCDANGNGCAPCNDPGPMNAHKWNWAEHGWRMNNHHPMTMTSLCRRTTNRQLNAGTYKIRIYVQSSSDAYSGHGGQYGSIQVEEVYKA